MVLSRFLDLGIGDVRVKVRSKLLKYKLSDIMSLQLTGWGSCILAMGVEDASNRLPHGCMSMQNSV